MNPEIKVTLIEQAFQSVYTRKKLKKVSLRQFVNRLLLLTHKPRIFLFYKKTDKGWKFSFSTHGDYLYLENYEKQITKRLHDNDLYMPGEKLDTLKNGVKIKWPKAPYEIGKTGFGIIIVAIEKGDSVLDSGRIVNFTSPIKICGDNNINTEYPLLENLWKNFLRTEYSKTLGVEKRIQMRLDQIDKNPQKEKNIINIKPPNEPFKSNSEYQIKELGSDAEFVNCQLELLEGILNKAYRDVCETPLVCNKGKTPPNLFFFVRYYGETCKRFENGLESQKNDPYPYSLKICLPKKQKKHVKKTFESIAKKSKANWNKSKTEGDWDYSYQDNILKEYKDIFGKPKPEKNSCYPDDELDALFWYEVQENTNGIDNIIKYLQKPFGSDARSFVDPAMVTGYIHYRSGVFSENGKERVSKGEWEKGFGSDDVRRMVYFHYLLSAAAPESHYENLGTMTVPLNIAGQPFVSLVQAIVTKDETDLDYTDKVSWPRNFHFFTDIARHCVRKLRYHSKRHYLNEIEQIIKLVFEKNIEISEVGDKRKVYIDMEKVQIMINKYLRLLCRVWP